jgi:hypothetical protein
MSLDLYLLPVDSYSNGHGHAHQILNWMGARDVRNFLDEAKIKPSRIPRPFQIDCHLGVTRDGDPKYGNLPATDPWGEPYTWIEAEFLLPALEADRPDDPVTAFVRALPPSKLIILGWR